MGWLAGWSYRVPIAVDNTTPAATSDVQAPIPADWDHFWDAIDASGNEIRVTQADGFTPVGYQWASTPAFSKTNTTGLLEIDNLTCDGTNAGMCVAWLYYGNSGASDGSSSFTASTPVDGFIQANRPGAFSLIAQPVRPGVPQPPVRFQKTTSERIVLWINVSRLLERRTTESAGHLEWEEVKLVSYLVQDSGGTDDSGTMAEAAETRFVEVPSGRDRGFWIGMIAKAGTEDNYSIQPTIRTVAPEIDISGTAMVLGNYRILSPRAYLTVKDIDTQGT